MSLSAEQQIIVENHSKNTCILAGAGSGKTRTIVQLIVNDIIAGIPPKEIIAFTFTHKAADELLTRVFDAVSKVLPNTRLDGIFIGTIHSWCLKYLQDQEQFINYSSLDELHMYCLINRLYDRLNIGSIYGGHFPKGVKEFIKDLEIYYNENLSEQDIPANMKPAILAFRAILSQNKLLTFGDMVKYSIEVLNQHGPVLNLSGLYVDEYQDVNPAQVALIKAMITPATKLTVVGDDLQCIYNWRGSDVNRILNYSVEFDDTQIFRLKTNYRSEPVIVELTNKIINTIKIRDKEKVLVPGNDPAEGTHVFWLTAKTEAEQAKILADVVEKYLSAGTPANQIAILLRSVQGSGQPIVDELERRRIPVQCPLLGRGGDFVTHFLIPIFQWLLIDQSKPMNEQDEEELSQLGDSIWQNAQLYTSVDEMSFWAAVNIWVKQIEVNSAEAYNIRKNLYEFLDAAGIKISNEESSLMLSIGLASQIIRSVEEIHRRRIKGIDRKTSRGIMSECYYALVLYRDSFGESTPLINDFKGVIVTTVHQSKGLEWPVVILPELNRSRFPTRLRGHNTSYADEIARRYGTTLEDEKRLFYVAASRARSKLFLISKDPLTKGHSSFLQDLINAKFILPYLNGIPSNEELLFKNRIEGRSDETLKIGLADLLIFMECPFQYGLRRVVNLQPVVGDELGFGKGLHELIQRRFASDEEWSELKLDKEIELNVSIPYMSEEAERNSKSTIKSRYEDLRDLKLFDNKVITETSIDVYLDNAVISGKIDGIKENDDGSVTVLDWKSTIHKELFSRYTQQVLFYVYALRNQGKHVSAAYLIDVGASSKENKLHTEKIDISEDTVTTFIESISKATKEIKEHVFLANNSKQNCSICDMQKLCAYKTQ